ncbi:MAG TPA: ABC transporter ATP-binding protein [Bdellovibrionota bacterium]|jgi:ABC-2 type transport system ATP-binding protein|nr:ABC transporter ATP-binding protein [Bdellovibrionota bacterium]
MAAPAISITVSEVRKSFRDVKALDGLSVTFRAGAMHGVIGPEGAGKTTLMRVMLGLLRAQNGEVKYQEDDAEVPFDRIRASVAYMPQSQSLYADLSIGEHLDFFRALYSIPEAEYQKKRKELLHITRLAEFVERPAGKLSGGMYKKLGLMCALLRSPRVMLLDEPTNGVDPISRREFWELLYRLSDQKILIIVTTAYMDEAERCEEVHLMEKGKLVAEGVPRELLKSEGVKNFDELFLQRGARG